MNNLILVSRTTDKNKPVAVPLPSSKSISNRLLIIRFLSQSEASIRNLSDSEDTRLLDTFLNQINKSSSGRFFCKNAGTTTRFLLSLLSITKGEWTIDADSRMQSRPVLPLVRILQSLGADIEYKDDDTVFPIHITGTELQSHGALNLENHFTSQIISSLLLISPYIKGGLTLHLPDSQVSFPYIQQTISLANGFGAKILKKNNVLVSEESEYSFHSLEVERDYSSLCFVYAFVCLGKFKKVLVPDLKPSSLQGDYKAVDFFSDLGVETRFEESQTLLSYNPDFFDDNKEFVFDVKETPDVFLPLVVSLYALGVKAEVSGIETQKVKESDRLSNIVNELNKLGERCFVEDSRLVIQKGIVNPDSVPSFSSHNDHRIFMALSSLAFVCRKIVLDNSSCVKKSWRTFFNDVSLLLAVQDFCG